MSNQIRVRFAPSPTGYLHVGGARTALYNYLYARQNNGQFLLRIEDTDKTRSTEEAIAQIMRSLKWLGLRWHEVPYRQTRRQRLYQEAAHKLVQQKKAYLCFCPPGGCSLDCRNLDEKQMAQLQKKGTKPTVRLATPTSGTTTFQDLTKGRISVENDNIDDYILTRSDGTPTYNLAVVVDDHTMDITHVIRGDDHLSNTPRQIVLYQALGYQTPEFAHLPLIAGPDKKPLSKRYGAVSIEELKRLGYLPEALINYLALLGWGYDEKTTFFTVDELLEKFSLEKVSKNPAIWDQDKLLWLNGEYIRKLSVKELAHKLKLLLQKSGIVEDNAARLENITIIIRERIKTLNEALPLIEFFYKRISPDKPALDLLKQTEDSGNILKKSIEHLKHMPSFRYYEIEHSLRLLSHRLNIKPSLLFQLIRASISGRTVSPPLFQSLEILGKEETLARLKSILSS